MQQAIAMRKPEQELICALDHLVKAIANLPTVPKTAGMVRAHIDALSALSYTRAALKLLKEEKEE